MRKLVSTHAEDMGGFVVEPYTDFDESEADEATIKRLESEGKLADADSKSSKKGDK